MSKKGESELNANDMTDEMPVVLPAQFETAKGKAKEALFSKEMQDKTIGHWLCRARKAMGVEIEEAAKHLRLAPRIIQALENDAFEELGKVTFIRGYLRAYARYLDLRDDVIIDSFNALDYEEPDSAQKVKMEFTQRKVSEPGRKKWFYSSTLAIVLVLLVLMVTWWYQRVMHSSELAKNVVTVPQTAQATDTEKTLALAEPPSQPISASENDITLPVSSSNESPTVSTSKRHARHKNLEMPFS